MSKPPSTETPQIDQQDDEEIENEEEKVMQDYNSMAEADGIPEAE